MKSRYSVLAIVLAIALIMLPASAMGLPTKTQGNAMAGSKFNTEQQHFEDIPFVTNTNKYQAAKYKVGTSPGMKVKGYESKKNTIKAKKKKGLNYVFKTELFLPIKVKNKGDYDIQNQLIVGKYIYVVYVSKKDDNKGFMVRYDYKKLQKLGVTESKTVYLLRRAIDRKLTGQKMEAIDKKIVKCMKIGPIFTMGHGQTFAYNYKTKELWMAMDLRDKNGKLISNDVTTFERINLTKMKPDKAIKFTMKGWSPSASAWQTPFTMTFDENGTGYFVRDFKTYYGLFAFTIDSNDVVRVEYVQNIKYGPSKVNHIQSMSYNPYRNTINIITNGGMMSFPSAKVGKLKASDFKYELFKTNREFETIQFDSKGYAYLQVSKGPEILKSTKR